jgi:hypothetical protein
MVPVIPEWENTSVLEAVRSIPPFVTEVFHEFSAEYSPPVCMMVETNSVAAKALDGRMTRRNRAHAIRERRAGL